LKKEKIEKKDSGKIHIKSENETPEMLESLFQEVREK